MSRLCAQIVIGVLSCGLGGGCGSPTGPGIDDLTGIWTGAATDASGSGEMKWQITQTGASFSGTLATIDRTTLVNGRGTVSGSVSGDAVQFSMTVPAGGFDGAYATCSMVASGSAQVSSALMIGTYAGANSCSGAVASGQISLTRSR